MSWREHYLVHLFCIFIRYVEFPFLIRFIKALGFTFQQSAANVNNITVEPKLSWFKSAAQYKPELISVSDRLFHNEDLHNLWFTNPNPSLFYATVCCA